MYGDYWNLARLPFENSCDPLFFFRGRSHEAALLKLQYVVEQSKGIALLVGEHGLGKTCVARTLEADLQATCQSDGESFPVVRLMFPRLSAEEMLRYLAGGLSGSDQSTHQSGDALILSLEESLREHADTGRRPSFVIDDAHLIDDPAVLQVLAQVMSLCESQRLPLSLILLGQPELIRQVQRIPALDSRLMVRSALQPFVAEETAAYIGHRLKVAGLDDCMFDAAALEAFHRLSQGIPRRINQLCDLALLVGSVDRRPSLGRGDVEAAAEELLSVASD